MKEILEKVVRGTLLTKDGHQFQYNYIEENHDKGLRFILYIEGKERFRDNYDITIVKALGEDYCRMGFLKTLIQDCIRFRVQA